MVNLLIGCTGSVATIKLPLLVKTILCDVNGNEGSGEDKSEHVEIRVIVTEHAKHFYNATDLPKGLEIYTDDDEWAAWARRGDPVLHIELGKWADVMIIAPLDANTLAKIANGLCDNLLTCTVRAWETKKPLLFCPAMNTKMYQHPLTGQQIDVLKSWGYCEVPVIEKTLMCGDYGAGAMAEVADIVGAFKNSLVL